MSRALLGVLVFALCACVPYAEFTLAPPPPGPDVRFEWQVHDAPVLTRGPGTWESSDVLNPSVVRFRGALWNMYSGFDGRTWHTGIATASDPLTWKKDGRVLSPGPEPWEGGYIAANGAALVHGGVLRYYYQAGDPPRIGLAASSDGRAWNRHGNPVLESGPLGSWDERGAGDPYVIESGGALVMFYVGMDRARRQRLGVARSIDGVHWIKLRTNPILQVGDDGAFDENGLGEPAVWASNGHYWMLYTGRDRREFRRIGFAESLDGVHWQRSSRAPLLAGEENAWDSMVVCDPTVLPAGGGVHVWFGGGDVARPDERINGQIGYAFLRSIPRSNLNSAPAR